MVRCGYHLWLCWKLNIEHVSVLYIIMAALCYYIGLLYIFLSCGFFLLLFYSSFFPRLISVVRDWMSTILPHWCGLSANLECRSEMCCMQLAENTGCKKPPSGHHRTALSGYIFATKARIDNGQKLIKQQYLLHMSPQYGKLRPTSSWDCFLSLGHPCKFQWVSLLGSVTLWRWTEGTTYIWHGSHHVGHWPTFLVCYFFDNWTDVHWYDCYFQMSL